MPTCLVREPAPTLASGLLTHLDRRPVDVDLARRQWDAYVAVLGNAGWPVTAVPPAPECPDSAFVEDTVVVRGRRALLTRPGAPERRGEVAGTRAVLAGLGYDLGEISDPETLDGGDVLTVGPVTYVGVGGRTTLGGCEQLGAFFGTEAVPVPMAKVLHLKSSVTALPDGTVLGYPPTLDGQWDRLLPVPEESGSHVVVLAEDTVLMATSAPATRRLLEDRGLHVVAVDISEFEKLEGCVTCLSVRLRD